MAKDEIKNELIGVDIKKKKCSICNREILQSQYFIRDIITNELICSNCDDGNLPIKSDTLLSID